MATHNYIAEQAKGFRTRVTVGKGDEQSDALVQFVDGQYNTKDDDIAAALDAAIAKGKISRFCRKVDRAAAEKLAADFLSRQKRMGGVKGQLSAQAAQNAMRTEVAKRDEALVAQDIDPEKLSEESGVQLTVPVAETRIQEVSKPEVPETPADPKVASPVVVPALKLSL